MIQIILLELPILAGTLLYVGFLAVLTWGLLRLRRPEGLWKPSITVVVPMHNEESGVAATLEAIQKQDYQAPWEVVCVDDRSSDRTAEIVQSFVDQDPRFRMVQISASEEDVPSPKKRALARGMAAARHEVLATTDADCIPPPTGSPPWAAASVPMSTSSKAPSTSWATGAPATATNGWKCSPSWPPKPPGSRWDAPSSPRPPASPTAAPSTMPQEDSAGWKA